MVGVMAAADIKNNQINWKTVTHKRKMQKKVS